MELPGPSAQTENCKPNYAAKCSASEKIKNIFKIKYVDEKSQNAKYLTQSEVNQVKETESCTKEVNSTVTETLQFVPSKSKDFSEPSALECMEKVSVPSYEVELPGPSTKSQDEVTKTEDPFFPTEHWIQSESESFLVDNDPARYAGKRLNSQTITQLIKLGPSQPNTELFPYSGRKFLTAWFKAKLPDGTEKCRKWLSYSITTHRAYCIYCIMFGGPKTSELWTKKGFYDMDHAVRDICRHEVNSEHANAEKAVIRWIRGQRIDRQHAAVKNVIVERNRHVASCMIDCAKYLATEMMAFQGHNSKSGKFLNLFKLIAKHNPYAHSYLEKLDSDRQNKNRLPSNLLS